MSKKKMLCESCGKVEKFDRTSTFDRNAMVTIAEAANDVPLSPNYDYECIACGWMQTSPEGGHCEVLCSWLHPDKEGRLLGLWDDADLLTNHLWQTCNGKFGKHYAKAFAVELLSTLKHLGIKLGGPREAANA